MKPVASLLSKILILFFINLFLLIGVLVIFLTLQSRIDFLSILGSTSGDRLRITSRQIAYELKRTPENEWPEIIKRYSEIHKIDFSLVTREEVYSTESFTELPPPVIQEALKLFRLKPYHHPDLQPLPLEKERQAIKRKPRFRLHTQNPDRYWMGLPILLQTERKSPLRPVILLASSSSITGNGFFFDPVPWVIVAILVVIVSVMLWIPFVRHLTGPLTRMTTAAEEIARGRFDVKIDEKRSDEIGRLANAINHMTGRLSGYVKGQKRFLGDVAHELGSPIARLQFGVGILENKTGEQHREQIDDVKEDIAELSMLVNELLSFSRAELTPENVQLKSTQLLPLVQKTVQREAGADSNIQIKIPAEITVKADATLLTRALANLIRNALRYAGDKGPIFIASRSLGDKTEIMVRDSGPGVPEKHLNKLFDPFYRPESSRDRELGGVGLGLTIVKTCIEACDGMVTAQNGTPCGLVVTIILNSSPAG